LNKVGCYCGVANYVESKDFVGRCLVGDFVIFFQDDVVVAKLEVSFGVDVVPDKKDLFLFEVGEGEHILGGLGLCGSEAKLLIDRDLSSFTHFWVGENGERVVGADIGNKGFKFFQFLWIRLVDRISFVVGEGMDKEFQDSVTHFLQGKHLGPKLVFIAWEYSFDEGFSFNQVMFFAVEDVNFAHQPIFFAVDGGTLK
jgi:hypothetical protein